MHAAGGCWLQRPAGTPLHGSNAVLNRLAPAMLCLPVPCSGGLIKPGEPGSEGQCTITVASEPLGQLLCEMEPAAAQAARVGHVGLQTACSAENFTVSFCLSPTCWCCRNLRRHH